MPSLGVPELLIILVIIIAIFGAGKLANLGGALGKGVRDFRKNIRPDEDEAPKPVEAPRPVEAPKAASSAEVERPESDSAPSES